MIAPFSFHHIRAQLARALAWLLLVLALLMMPSALAGDRPEPDTFIITRPEEVTSSTTADFTFESTATQAGFLCAVDDEPEAPCDSGAWQREGLSPGFHTFSVYSFDLEDPKLVDETPAVWEWDVVAEPPLDGGVPDGGSTGEDGGSSGSDAGPGGNDGGSSGNDAGSPGGDAGTATGDGGSTGSDAGSPGGRDAGPGGDDGGTSGGEDSGTPGGDGGAPGDDDAGTGDGTPDAGGDDNPRPPDDPGSPEALDYLGGGVGCTGAPAPGAVAGLLLLVLALRRRRRR
ncbi:MYXO-CTERM sorting domain-containing protein [Pyxidicoccus sp. 3LG]